MAAFEVNQRRGLVGRRGPRALNLLFSERILKVKAERTHCLLECSHTRQYGEKIGVDQKNGRTRRGCYELSTAAKNRAAVFGSSVFSICAQSA